MPDLSVYARQLKLPAMEGGFGVVWAIFAGVPPPVAKHPPFLVVVK